MAEWPILVMVLQEILSMRETEPKMDLLAIDDFDGELQQLIDWAIRMKNDDGFADSFKPLDGMSIGSIYEKPSTRTRVSFEVGVSKLGGQPLTLLANDIQLGKSESIADTAAVLSRFMDGITYRCFGHSDVQELAKHSSVPVINALSDMHHPCQAAADLMTISEKIDSVKGHVSWVGDGNNVLHDLMLACASLGIDIKYATPIGFEPDADIVSRAVTMASDNGKMDAFDGFQINEELVSHADSDYLFMHCLPAHRGEEVTNGVIDSKNSVVFDQAENRMWAQMSLLTRMCNEAAWHTYNQLY